MKKFIFLIALMVYSMAYSQTDTRYSQYMFNGLVINPAYTGTTNNLNAVLFYRNQWADIQGAPKTISLSIHSPVGAHRKVGLGFIAESDKIGANDILDLYSLYSYKVKLGNGVMSAGLQGGLTIIQSSLANLLTPEGVPDVMLGNNTYAKPNFGFGLYYYNERFFAGFSVPTILDYRKADIGPFFDRQYRQYIVSGGMIMPLSENIKLKPSILFKSIPTISPVRFDLNAALYYQENLWIGAAFRTFDGFDPESIGVQLGLKLNNGLKIGYGYDYNLNDIATVSNIGTHQIVLGFEKPLKNTSVLSPRYF